MGNSYKVSVPFKNYILFWNLSEKLKGIREIIMNIGVFTTQLRQQTFPSDPAAL